MTATETTGDPFHAVLPAEASVSLEKTALVVVDLTNFDAHPEHGLARIFAEEGGDMSYYWDRVETLAVPNSLRLVEAFRGSGGRIGRIMFTRVGAQFADYADSLKHLRELHRRAGTVRGSVEFELRDEFAARPGEIVIDKPGASVFATSNADMLLRNAGVRRIVFCGVVTNVCVLMSAMNAWDLGYEVAIVDDACAADSPEIHHAALQVAGWLGCRVINTDEVLTELDASST